MNKITAVLWHQRKGLYVAHGLCLVVNLSDSISDIREPHISLQHRPLEHLSLEQEYHPAGLLAAHRLLLICAPPSEMAETI